MGIRYYAYPILASDIDLARRDPVGYLNSHPLVDEDKPYDEQLRLDLDKSWRDLQELFTVPHCSPAEWGMDLVRGNVHYDSGFAYQPHYAVLTPEQVATVATQIARFDKVDVLAMYVDGGRSHVRETGRIRDYTSYVGHFLAEAQKFTAACAEAGYGVIYTIG